MHIYKSHLYLNCLRDFFQQRLPQSSQVLVLAQVRRTVNLLQRRRLVVLLLATFKEIQMLTPRCVDCAIMCGSYDSLIGSGTKFEIKMRFLLASSVIYLGTRFTREGITGPTIPNLSRVL